VEKEMTDRIAVTPERLREISERMSTGAADVEGILSRLSRNVAPVRTEWVGVAKVQFNTLWDQLQQDAGGLHSVLTGIAKLTECAATAYEATEQNIVNSFDEFRIRPGVVRDAAKVPVQVVEVVEIVDAGAGSGLDPSDTVDGWPPPAVEQLVEQSQAALAEQAQVELVEQSQAALAEQAEVDEITERFNQIQEVLSTTASESDAVDDLGVTETEGSPADDVDGRPKTGARMPWARFMTKAVHDSKAREVKLEGKVRERRFKTSESGVRPGSRLCRLCFTVVVIEPEYIETTDMHVYLCCPNCGQSFPIRHSDSEALSTPPTPIS
jgi:WXG100 family type VII secretion target